MKHEWQVQVEEWTKSEVIFLSGAILAGKSYGEAQALLNAKYGTNRSRNSIAGKVHRLKYSLYAEYTTTHEKKPKYAGLMA